LLLFPGDSIVLAMYQPHYLSAINPHAGDLKTNLLSELRSYLRIQGESDEDLYRKCQDAGRTIFDEWRRLKIDPKDKKAVTQFYLDTTLYCYELIGLEIDVTEPRQEQLQTFVKVLKESKKLYGCDYGSGVGTLGIYFNKNGIHCDFADVSETNLKFIAERLKARQIRGPKLIALLEEELPENHYDFITAFDVIEHVTDPVEVVQHLSTRLKTGGFLIFNLLYHNEEGTPHLLQDPNLIRKNIRSFGFKKVTSIGEFKIYQKVSRPTFLNSAIHLTDSVFWDFKDKMKRSASSK
jgi:SAM-dependent methyltransferase